MTFFWLKYHSQLAVCVGMYKFKLFSPPDILLLIGFFRNNILSSLLSFAFFGLKDHFTYFVAISNVKHWLGDGIIIGENNAILCYLTLGSGQGFVLGAIVLKLLY